MTPERAISPPRIGNRQRVSRCVVDVLVRERTRSGCVRILPTDVSAAPRRPRLPFHGWLHISSTDQLCLQTAAACEPSHAPLDRHSCKAIFYALVSQTRSAALSGSRVDEASPPRSSVIAHLEHLLALTRFHPTSMDSTLAHPAASYPRKNARS